MTVPVPDQLEYIYGANGVLTDFGYPKRFLQKDEIVVILRDIDGNETRQILNTHYTIAGSSWPMGGNISFYTAPSAGLLVVLYRQTQAKQTVDLENNQRNDAPSVETQLDRLTMAIQDRGRGIDELFGRAVKMPFGYTGSTIMPWPSPNKFIGWNNSGNALQNYTVLESSGLIAGDTGLDLLASGTVLDARTVLDLVPGAYGFTAFKWATVDDARNSLGIRLRLSADVNFYVRPDGNDNNLGLSNSPSGAFKTISRARQVVYSNLDLNGFTAYVNIYNGTYNETVYCVGQPVGQGANPTPIVFRGLGASRDDVNVPGGFQSISGARIRVSQMRLDPAGANNYCLFTRGVGSYLQADNINFGQCGPAGSSITDHMMATDGAGLEITGPYAIHGGALNHYHCTEGAFMRIAGQVVSVLNNPAFNGQFAGVASGSLFVIGVSFSGSATGRTYLVHYNGVIRANQDSRSIFPGNIHGIERSGGRLDAASMFSAHKNGINQNISGGDWRKITMDALQFTYGGDYSTSNSSWNPRGGEIEISATVSLSSVPGPDQILGVSIFKNGTEFKSALLNSAGDNSTLRSISVTVRDTTDGSAVYELYVRGGNTGTATVSGNSAWTHWSGRQY